MIDQSQIKTAIEASIEVLHIEIRNPMQDGLHFEAIVVSPAFRGKSLVEQHQMVMLPLKEHFKSVLHALSLKTLTPEKWNEQKHS